MVVAALDVDAILADPGVRIVVCCGAGGVGKTTTAAALALRAAEQHGRRTVVLTIDPARRLAQALGLSGLDNTPRQVKGTNGEAGGELHAMMLDMKRTFDEVVLTHTDPRRADEIFANPFYQAMSTTFAGTQEYMAMEKLGQLRARNEWDLIVLVTPSFGMFSRVVQRVIGGQLLADVSGFVAALDSMFGGFRERAEQTYRILQAPETAFLVVAAPEPDAIREAGYFAGRLAADRMPLHGLVLNRVHRVAAGALSAPESLAAAAALDGHAVAADALRIH